MAVNAPFRAAAIPWINTASTQYSIGERTDPRARTMHKDIITGIWRFGHLRSRLRSELLDWFYMFIIKDLAILP